MLKTYYRLTKPGIVYGNAITAAGGFFLASRGQVDAGLLVATLAGLSAVIAAACVSNNYLDRDIDRRMARTKNRALVTGKVSPRAALTFAAVLGAAGTFILLALTNLLAAGLALFGYFAYVFLYGIGKRRTVHGTLIGSISGAIPPVVGYTAVTGRLDAAAIILFLVLVTWQMPHFYSIATYRADDYSAAGIPVLPVRRGVRAAKNQIIVYIVAFLVATSLLTITGYTGLVYLVVMLAFGGYWLRLAYAGFTAPDDKLWARQLFRFSLIVILVFSAMISVGYQT